MASEAKPQPRPLRRWLQKVRDGWREAGARSARIRAARKADEGKSDRYRL